MLTIQIPKVLNPEANDKSNPKSKNKIKAEKIEAYGKKHDEKMQKLTENNAKYNEEKILLESRHVAVMEDMNAMAMYRFQRGLLDDKKKYGFIDDETYTKELRRLLSEQDAVGTKEYRKRRMVEVDLTTISPPRKKKKRAEKGESETLSSPSSVTLTAQDLTVQDSSYLGLVQSTTGNGGTVNNFNLVISPNRK